MFPVLQAGKGHLSSKVAAEPAPEPRGPCSELDHPRVPQSSSRILQVFESLKQASPIFLFAI